LHTKPRSATGALCATSSLTSLPRSSVAPLSPSVAARRCLLRVPRGYTPSHPQPPARYARPLPSLRSLVPQSLRSVHRSPRAAVSFVSRVATHQATLSHRRAMRDLFPHFAPSFLSRSAQSIGRRAPLSPSCPAAACQGRAALFRLTKTLHCQPL